MTVKRRTPRSALCALSLGCETIALWRQRFWLNDHTYGIGGVRLLASRPRRVFSRKTLHARCLAFHPSLLASLKDLLGARSRRKSQALVLSDARRCFPYFTRGLCVSVALYERWLSWPQATRNSAPVDECARDPSRRCRTVGWRFSRYKAG